jgi:hypothetical protein
MATREQVRAAMHRQPFLGFTLHLVDGRSYAVKHPDFIAVSAHERGRDVTIYDDKATHRLDILLISEIEEPDVPESAGSPAASPSDGDGE